MTLSHEGVVDIRHTQTWEVHRDNDVLMTGAQFLAMRGRLNRAERLLLMVSAHYSGSLDHQPAYVRAIRDALDEEHRG